MLKLTWARLSARVVPLKNGATVFALLRLLQPAEATRNLAVRFLDEDTSRASGRPKRRGGVERPVSPGRAREAVLEQHAHDRHHRQPPVGQITVEALLVLHRVANATETGKPPAPDGLVVSRWARVVIREDGGLHQADEGNDLKPAYCWYLPDRSQPVGDVCELQVHLRRQIPRPFSAELRLQVAHASAHRDAPVLVLSVAPPFEYRLIAVGGQAQRVPKAQGRLCADLVLERGRRDGAPLGPPEIPRRPPGEQADADCAERGRTRASQRPRRAGAPRGAAPLRARGSAASGSRDGGGMAAEPAGQRRHAGSAGWCRWELVLESANGTG